MAREIAQRTHALSTCFALRDLGLLLRIILLPKHHQEQPLRIDSGEAPNTNRCALPPHKQCMAILSVCLRVGVSPAVLVFQYDLYTFWFEIPTILGVALLSSQIEGWRIRPKSPLVLILDHLEHFLAIFVLGSCTNEYF